MSQDLDQSLISTITDAIPAMMAYWDRDLRCRFANKAYLEWFGRQPETLLGETMQTLLGERLFALNEPHIKAALSGEPQNFERELIRADGSVGHTWANYTPHRDADGGVCGFFATVSDITPLREAERRVQESEFRYRFLAEHGTDKVFELDHDLVRRYVSPACREILGYDPEELTGIAGLSLVHPDDAERVNEILRCLLNGTRTHDTVTYRVRHHDGHWLWAESTIAALLDPATGRPSGAIGSLRDISAVKAIEVELEQANRRLQALAGQDGLTGLANRRTFDEVLEKEFKRARRERRILSLALIDVDQFKAFNDRYGHPEGDACLRRVSEAIRTTVRRPADLVARYGGEEFAVILPHTDEFAASQVADQIREAVLQLAIPHQDSAIGLLTISCGIAAAEDFDRRAASLVKQADRALYRAKENGRNNVVRASKLLSVVGASSARA